MVIRVEVRQVSLGLGVRMDWVGLQQAGICVCVVTFAFVL